MTSKYTLSPIKDPRGINRLYDTHYLILVNTPRITVSDEEPAKAYMVEKMRLGDVLAEISRQGKRVVVIDPTGVNLDSFPTPPQVVLEST